MKYDKLLNIKKNTTVITGATGMLGKEFALALAQNGSKIAIIDLNRVKTEKLAKLISTKYKIKCIGLACDVSNDADVANMANTVEKKLGKIDVLINNAATKGKSLDDYFKPLEKYNLDTWKEIMDVNLNGMYIVSKEIGTRMAKRKKGSIIQTSSIYSSHMASDQRIYKGSSYLGKEINTPAAYSVSKSGIVGLTLHLASYWAKDNIRVNTISPGGVFSGQNEKFVRSYSSRVPMNRMARKEEIVGAIVYLASDASTYVTGQNLFIDGGLSGW